MGAQGPSRSELRLTETAGDAPEDEPYLRGVPVKVWLSHKAKYAERSGDFRSDDCPSAVADATPQQAVKGSRVSRLVNVRARLSKPWLV